MRRKQQHPSQGHPCNARRSSQISQGDEATSRVRSTAVGTGPRAHSRMQQQQQQQQQQQSRKRTRQGGGIPPQPLNAQEAAAGDDDDSEDAWGELAPPRVRRVLM
eukprot:1095398-Pelagomonas_calceolata.AAC.1